MEERNPNILPEIECDSAKPSVRSRKDIYQLNWSIVYGSEMYRNQTPVYLVKDDHGEILEGTFYAEEIQKVIKQDDVYKIKAFWKNDGKEEEYSI